MSIQPASPSGGVSQAKVRLALACHPQLCRWLLASSVPPKLASEVLEGQDVVGLDPETVGMRQGKRAGEQLRQGRHGSLV